MHELTKINSDVRYSIPAEGGMSNDTLPIPGKRQEGRTTYFGGIGIVNTNGSRQYNTKNRITAELDQSFGMLEHLELILRALPFSLEENKFHYLKI